MKKSILFFAFICIITGLFAQQKIIVGTNYVNPNEVILVADRGTSTTLKFNLNELNLTEVEYGTAFAASSSKAPLISEKGAPELFYLTATFIIPDRGGSELEISYGTFTDYENIEIAPSKGPIQRNIDPETIPYEKGEVYDRDAFYPGTFTKLREPFIMRDIRGQSLDIYPVQYNPVTKVLRIYSEITVTVNNTHDAGINEFANQKRNNTINAEFNQLYGSMFINHSANRTPQHPYTLEEAGELLIICHPPFMEAMKPYVDWKRSIGRKTTLVSTATTGTTVTAIKTYVQNYYDDPNNNLTYILLVGDNEQIPTRTYNSQAGGSPNPAGSDHFYGQLVGNDPYVEAFVGRFSAENIAHVQTQVQRTIYHERDLTTADTWLGKAIGLAANEGGSGSQGHDGPEADYAHMNKIRTRMLDYGYDPVYQEYTCNVPGVPNTTVTQISSRFNTGVGAANYCNHGSQNAWALCGTNYTSDHVGQLQNAGKLPYIMSVACVNGRFMGGSCFAEAWLRATQGGQPTGAVAVLMATLNLWWNPPMTAQDAYVNICLDLPPYYPTEVAPGTKRTFGGATINATMLMMNIHGSNNNDLSKEDFESWLVFGDPTLMLRTKTPQEMAISHNNVIFFGMSEFAVTCDAEGALVTMSAIDNDEVIILGTAVVADGIANINLYEPITSPAPLTLTVIGHNKVTYINTDIIATPAAGPYVVPAGYVVQGNGKLTYTSVNTEIEVTLNNVGVEATTALTVTIACNDSQITIINNTATCPSIPAGGSAIVKFNVTVANDIPDNKSFLLDVTTTESGKGQSWSGKLPLKAYAPEFSLEKVLINGVEGGNLEAGSVANITTIVKNKGGADAYAVKGDLEIKSPYISFACEDLTLPAQLLNANETMELTFTVVTESEMPYGHIADIDLLLNAQYDRSFTTSFTASNTGSSNYCAATYTTGCGSNDKFTQVILYKTSEPTNLLINKLDGTCTSGGYENYTNITIPLEPGQQYTIKVKCGFSSQTVKGWFDFNGNNVFDANEQLITLTCSTSNTEYTANFTIPTEFTPGTSRFRLRCVYSNTAFTACSSQTYGQVHDYTIVLPELYPRVQNVEAELSASHITVNWELPEEGTPNGYNVYRNGNKLNSTLITAPSFTEQNITEGVYAYNVTAMYETKESYAEMSNVICFFELCEIPEDLTGTDELKTAILTWNAPKRNSSLLGYNIYRDGDKLNNVLLTGREYRDEELENGKYIYNVSAVYELMCEESEFTEGVEVEIDYVGINDLQNNSHKIYPNPTTGYVTISGEGLSNVEIYDIQGRLLAQYNNVKEKLQINVNNYDNGIYLVRLYSENSVVVVKRLVVIK